MGVAMDVKSDKIVRRVWVVQSRPIGGRRWADDGWLSEEPTLSRAQKCADRRAKVSDDRWRWRIVERTDRVVDGGKA